MSIKIADLLHRDAQTEKWFHWAPEDAKHLKIEMLLKVCPPKAFRKITEKHTKRVFSRLVRGHVEETDNEAAADEMIKGHVIGWRDITVEKIQQLVMTKPTEAAGEEEVEFSTENLMLLVQEIPDLGAWIIATVTNVRNFNEPTKEDETKNS